MKLKTINSILTNKLNHWLNSIEDKAVRELARNNTIITGGSIVSLLTNQPVNDYDLYFRTKEATLAVANYYVQKYLKDTGQNAEDAGMKVMDLDDRVKVVIQSVGVASTSEGEVRFETDPQEAELADAEAAIGAAKEMAEKDKPKYRPVYITSNAITLSDKIQLVIRFFGEPEAIHLNYDFQHCVGYFTSWDKKTIVPNETYECILNKELRYRGSLYPICSIIRSRKFIERGWHINAGQYLKMCLQVNKLDLTDIKVLEDQLVGVDSSFFKMLIDALKNTDLKAVDSSYICEIIDRIF